VALGLLLAALIACGGGSAPPEEAAGRSGGSLQITGAGATFPNPLYQKWFSDYEALHPEVRINYQSVGSGAGIRQLTSRTVFFGASDSPMNDEQIQAAPGTVLHFPTVLGAVVPDYNLAGVPGALEFTGAVLADIYLGKITRWNDPALTRLNPSVPLPASDITVVHRSDGSGTTFIFADYLGKVSPEFRTTVGAATSVQWPVGIGGKGNEGVAGMVAQTPGSIGYIELVYALQNRMAYGSVQNANGEFVTASVESVTAAAAGAAATMPADFRVSITDAPGAGAYPISSFTWILLYQAAGDRARSRAMVNFMRWALTDGQAAASGLGYAPLPASVVEQELRSLDTIEVQ
jgi:phosphate transport system substrate-binding protein